MKQSAGILLFRHWQDQPEFFLVHPGGPFFAKKDAGWWTIPKGELLPEEAPLESAIREFEEETGYRPSGDFLPLQAIRQKGGKQVLCWAVAGDLDPAAIVSNTFKLQWPPRSGKMQVFPEIDRAGWFAYDAAKARINEQQTAFLDELVSLLGGR